MIGILHGSKNTLTGIVDVAMVGSMYSKGKYQDMLNSYGMVIMDECHHAASKTSIQLLQKSMRNMFMEYQLHQNGVIILIV